MLEECFDFDQASFLTKNVRETSSNMPATRSNIVEPKKCYITLLERVAEALDLVHLHSRNLQDLQ